jgi:hypothetical protein
MVICWLQPYINILHSYFRLAIHQLQECPVPSLHRTLNIVLRSKLYIGNMQHSLTFTNFVQNEI